MAMVDPQRQSNDVLGWLTGELTARKQAGLHRDRREVTSLPNGQCIVNDRVVHNFAGNDYLGLAFHPDVIAAAKQATDVSGTGATASPLVAGRTRWHRQLEEDLAQFEQTEAAILFPSGMAANLGTIAALVGPGDLVISDKLNHASLIDGCRLSGARLVVYRGNDLETLDRAIDRRAQFRRALLVTDGVFSMDGTLAPLPAIIARCAAADIMLLVDEAHGTGVFGSLGRGASEELSVNGQIPIKMGTLSKALGSQGGFVCGSQTLVSYLWNHARTQIYSTALAPATCAAASAALHLAQSEPDRKAKLWELTTLLRAGLQDAGCRLIAESRGPIVAVDLATPERAIEWSARLLDAGFLVGAIRPPTVPHGTSRLRVTVSAAHSAGTVMKLVEQMALLCRSGEINSHSLTGSS